MPGGDSTLALTQMVGLLALAESMAVDVMRCGQGDNTAMAVPVRYEIPIAR
jgi:hypothetical protein